MIVHNTAAPSPAEIAYAIQSGGDFVPAWGRTRTGHRRLLTIHELKARHEFHLLVTHSRVPTTVPATDAVRTSSHPTRLTGTMNDRLWHRPAPHMEGVGSCGRLVVLTGGNQDVADIRALGLSGGSHATRRIAHRQRGRGLLDSCYRQSPSLTCYRR